MPPAWKLLEGWPPHPGPPTGPLRTSDVGLQVRDKGEDIEDMNDRMDATTLLCQSVPTTSRTTQDRDIGDIETIPASGPITEMVIDHPRLNFLGEGLV